MDDLDRNLMELRSALRGRRERNTRASARTTSGLATLAPPNVAPPLAVQASNDSDPTVATSTLPRGWWSRFFGT